MFQCGQFTFTANFECANLASVVEVEPSEGCTASSLCASCNARSHKTSATYSPNTGIVSFGQHLSSQLHASSSCNASTQNTNSKKVVGKTGSPAVGTHSSCHKPDIPNINFVHTSGTQQAQTDENKSVPNVNTQIIDDGKYSNNSAISQHQLLQNAVPSTNATPSCTSSCLHEATISGDAKCNAASTLAPVLPARPQHEFHLHTSPDCAKTEYENNNRTWFYFSIAGGSTGSRVRLRVMNLNKQIKLYAQGMRPVYQQRPPGEQPLDLWTRAPVQCHCWSVDGSTVLSWLHTAPAGGLVTYYAFTFPYSYTQLQNKLAVLDKSLLSHHSPSAAYFKNITKETKDLASLSCDADSSNLINNSLSSNNIYYVRELAIKSLDSHRIDLLTITSHLGKLASREDKLPGLFPDNSHSRPHKFENKKIIFISARVHPGETPASFVFNGFLDFIISDDSRALLLRDLYVFKLIPMLNPDGVIRGHYRTDQRGVNLNRVYGNPSIDYHPTIYAARALLLYYHFGEAHSEVCDDSSDIQLKSSSISTLTSPNPDSFPSTAGGEKASRSQPSMLDEDTCHSFGDAGRCQEAKHLGKSTASMEIDEPSASGWDVSSNISVDSSIHQGSLCRVSDMADMHDDCSNISGLSEAETGVTSMFGALAAVTTDGFDSYLNTSSKYESALSKPSNKIESGPTTRSVSNLIASPLPKSSTVSQQSALLTENNLELHCSVPENFATPLKSKSFLAPEAANMNSVHSPRPPPPSFESSLLRESLRQFTSTTTSATSFSLIQPSGPSTSATAPVAGSLPSSSESEAEVGIPGKEGLQVPVKVPLHTTRSAVVTKTFPTSPGSGYSANTIASNSKQRKETGGLHTYVDLHGHASKRGIFLYGNWFPDLASMVDNLLLAKLLSINCGNFDFNACNFTEKNMTVRDRKNGLSKEGSGRVAIMRLTGLLRSYTLECNYNTGRTVTQPSPLPGSSRNVEASGGKSVKKVLTSTTHTTSSMHSTPVPPKYTPAIFEECGRELAVSMLDALEESASPLNTSAVPCFSTFSSTKSRPSGETATSVPSVGRTSLRGAIRASGTRTAPLTWRGTINPQSRLTASQHGSLVGVRLFLRQFLTSPSSTVHTAHMSLHSSRAVAGKLSPLVSPSPLPSPRVTRGLRKNSGGGATGNGTSGITSSPRSLAKQRNKSQGKSRRYSWTAVDAENREPTISTGSIGGASTASPTGSAERPFSKFALGGSPKVKSLKAKSSSPKKKTAVARALMFTDVGEASCSSDTGCKASKVRSLQGLTANVSITPNLNVKLSISDAPESPCVIKKVEKVRRERSKAISSSFKKLKTGSGQPHRPSQQDKDGGSSPRSPLSCVFQGGIAEDACATSSSKVKVLKLPVKRRAKVVRSLSKCIVSKSLDVLPSAGITGSIDSCITASAAGPSSNKSNPGRAMKIVRKKLKSGDSGSESDLSMLQAAAILPSKPLIHWPIDQAIAATPIIAAGTEGVSSEASIIVAATNSHTAKNVTAAVGATPNVTAAKKYVKIAGASVDKNETGAVKKKKRKVPGRKSL